MTKNKSNKEKTIFQLTANLSFLERQMKNQLNKLFASQEITGSQGMLLIYLYMLDSPLETTQLAKYLALNRSSVTHLKQKLLELELIQETPGLEDKRKFLIQINDKGRKKAKSLLKDYQDSSFYNALNNLDEGDLLNFNKILLNITKASFNKTENFISFLDKLNDDYYS